MAARQAQRLEFAARSVLDASLQLNVDLQDVLLNPQTQGGVQVLEIFLPYPDCFAAFVEIVDEHHELSVRLLVTGMRRAPVTLHALFLQLEMCPGVGFQEIDQMDQEFKFRLGRVGVDQHSSQMIDVVDQDPMLLIQRIGTGRKSFVPEYHAHAGLFGFPSRLPPLPAGLQPIEARPQDSTGEVP